MTRILFTAKSAIQLVPRQLHDRRATVHVVRRKLCVTQRGEQRSHLALRKHFPALDRRFACNGRSEMLMTRRGARNAITGQRVERISQAAFGIESPMRHRHCVDDQRVASESLDLEAKLLEVLAICLERISHGRAEM